MTITYSQPHRYAGTVIKACLVLLVLVAAATVFGYNQMIKVRAAYTQATKRLDAVTIENAKLKNDLYAVIDNRSLTMEVERLGYIKESNPAYLQFLADGSVREGGKISLLER